MNKKVYHPNSIGMAEVKLDHYYRKTIHPELKCDGDLSFCHGRSGLEYGKETQGRCLHSSVSSTGFCDVLSHFGSLKAEDLNSAEISDFQLVVLIPPVVLVMSGGTCGTQTPWQRY